MIQDSYYTGETEEAVEADNQALSLHEFTQFLQEIEEQPPFRLAMNREADFLDGNQLDSKILTKMRERGIPPVVENLIKPAVEAACGYEAKKRTDWRVTPDSDHEGEEVALAYNEKLSEAERKARADRACSDAYYTQFGLGLGWVEVCREQDPFKFPYKCNSIHRNEIWWDMHAKEAMLGDARWLIRSKWFDKSVPKLMFPDSADLIEQSCNGWLGFDPLYMDGWQSTGLVAAQEVERGWTIEEQEWRDIHNKRVRLYEAWYRRWQNVLVLKTKDGRVIELDRDNPIHFQAIALGKQPEWAIVSKVRRAWYLGPHRLVDEPSPYRHNHFPYVPFWGHKEDATGVPYGRIRNMMNLQENVNAALSKIRWGLSASVITRTKNAVLMKEEDFRRMIARPDADIVLDQEHMSKPGSTFKIDRNFEINKQQYDSLTDSRAAIERAAGISPEFKGAQSTATSGVQENARIEQSQQSLADIDDNFNESRMQVGELLLSMIVQDSIGVEQEVKIPGNGLRPDRMVRLNEKVLDETGYEYLNNDVERTLLKVVLEEVPSSASFRTQQLAALSEAYKSAPPNAQAIMLPHLLNLTDVPNKKEILEALQQAGQQPSAEQQQLQIKQKEMEIKQMELEAKIKLIEAQSVKTLNEAQYSALQTAMSLVQVPATAPVADKVLENSGYVQPLPAGQDPGLSDLQIQQAQEQVAGLQAQPGGADANPGGPKPAPSPNTGQARGIETQRAQDNLV